MNTNIISTDGKRFVYVIGDLHGELGCLNEALHEVGFDKEKDLILSVGDLIDRGDDSLGCLKLINEPWFMPVMGNHEKMAFDAVNEGTDELINHWAMNGGAWFPKLSDADQVIAAGLIKKTAELPLMIEVNHKGKKVIICHADYPLEQYDIKAEGIEMHLLWSRERVNAAKRGESSKINGADLFVFGHTPFKHSVMVENQLYIDTGAVFGNPLTMINLDDYT